VLKRKRTHTPPSAHAGHRSACTRARLHTHARTHTHTHTHTRARAQTHTHTQLLGADPHSEKSTSIGISSETVRAGQQSQDRASAKALHAQVNSLRKKPTTPAADMTTCDDMRSNDAGCTRTMSHRTTFHAWLWCRRPQCRTACVRAAMERPCTHTGCDRVACDKRELIGDTDAPRSVLHAHTHSCSHCVARLQKRRRSSPT
jgi:hypothetical protein